MPGVLALEHVTLMLLIVAQEPSLAETIHVQAVQARLEPVQVGVCIVLERHGVKCYLPFQSREHGRPGMPGALALEHVTVMLLIVAQEPSLAETVHVQAVQARLEAVQVGVRIVSRRHDVTSYLLFQLREHGQLGMHGELVQEHVTVQQLDLEQETPVEVTHHARGSQVILEVAQV